MATLYDVFATQCLCDPVFLRPLFIYLYFTLNKAVAYWEVDGVMGVLVHSRWPQNDAQQNGLNSPSHMKSDRPIFFRRSLVAL
jgi:hypothetical protein